MEFGCGTFDKACKSARKASKKAGNNDAYCQHVTPKLAAHIAKKPCPTEHKKLLNYKRGSTEWNRASNAKCISDEAVCPTNYPGKGFMEPTGVNAETLEKIEEQMRSGNIIVPSVLKDFGGNKEKALAWLKDKLQKEKDAYDRVTASSGGKRRKSRRKKRRKSRKRRSRRRRK